MSPPDPLTMGDLEHLDIMKRSECAETRIHSGERMAKIESDLCYVKDDVREVKSDVKEIKYTLEEYIFEKKMRKRMLNLVKSCWVQTPKTVKVILIILGSLGLISIGSAGIVSAIIG